MNSPNSNRFPPAVAGRVPAATTACILFSTADRRCSGRDRCAPHFYQVNLQATTRYRRASRPRIPGLKSNLPIASGCTKTRDKWRTPPRQCSPATRIFGARGGLCKRFSSDLY
ncbi:hypothetical protein PUN28_013225 [Cardiocondyla obscurior]|uniref:Secreted protein n=1 Tax=Cardiocondyla obscurior TaxID=286306 RepID=A0AAW2F8T5_9HYME